MNAVLSSALRVFVVDDDQDTTECMRMLFKLWGHDVHVANDGAMALEQAPLINPDLMLIDLGMPVIDGLQVARCLRQRRELDHTSLVAVSGYADPRHQQDALAAGFDECLVKPLPADAILALVDRVRARIGDWKERVALSAEAVATSTEIKAKALGALKTAPLPPPEATSVRIHKSGISDVVSLTDRAAAERLRKCLSERGCRVGSVFEPQPGEAAFFNYSRRQLQQVLSDNPEYRIVK